MEIQIVEFLGASNCATPKALSVSGHIYSWADSKWSMIDTLFHTELWETWKLNSHKSRLIIRGKLRINA